MRYSTTEDTVLVAILRSGLTATIKIIDLINDNVISISSNACTESEHIPGIFRWNTNNIDDPALTDGFYNLFYEITSSDSKKFYGKFLYGGYVDKDVVVDLSEITDQHAVMQEDLELIQARI